MLQNRKNLLGLINRVWYVLVLWHTLYVCVCQKSRLYLTAGELAVLIPQVYIDQTIYTEYSIDGTSVTIHESLETIRKYSENLIIATNSQQQSLVRIHYVIQDKVFMYYVTPESVLKYCNIKFKEIYEVLAIPLMSSIDQHEDKENEDQEVQRVKAGVGFEGIEVVNQFEILLWSSRTITIVRIINTDQYEENADMEQDGDKKHNLTYSILQARIPESYSLRLNKCHYFRQFQYICSTNQHIIQFLQVPKRQQDIEDAETELKMVHVLTADQNLQCIMNVYQLQQHIVALCDCRQGCFNYQVQGGTMKVLFHLEMISMQRIEVMKVAKQAPKIITMAVASSNILALLRWGQDSIDVVDTMLIPELNQGILQDIDVTGDNICIKYRVEANPTRLAFQYIMMKFDNIRLQYDQLNIILNGPYVYNLNKALYTISNTGQLSIRMTNPFYLMVEYEPMPRNITIHATNTGSQQTKQSETITVQVVPVVEGHAYINEQLSQQVEANYQYTYPMQLSQIFIGRIIQYQIQQKQLPIHNEYFEPQPETYFQTDVLNIYQNKKILSIYNLLQCIRLENVGGWTLRRYMDAPNNKIYVEECKSQKVQDAGDFICQIKDMLEQISTSYDEHMMNSKQPYKNRQQNDIKNQQRRQYVRQPWKLADIGHNNTKSLNFEVWSRRLISGSEMLQYRGADIHEFIMVTTLECVHWIGRKHSVQIIANRYLLTAHSLNHSLVVKVYDTHMLQTVSKVSIKLNNYLEEPNRNEEDTSISSASKISNIYTQLTTGSMQGGETHNIVIGCHIHTNKTVAVMLIMELWHEHGRHGRHVQMTVERVVQLKAPSQYLRIFSFYLYSLNSTHITKYSLLTPTVETLYTHELELRLGNSLKSIRNVGRYMLLIYINSYRILDLKGELLTLVVDDHNIEVSGDSDGSGRDNGLRNVGIYDMIIFDTDNLLLGINNIMRLYNRNIRYNIGPFPISNGRIRSYRNFIIYAIPYKDKQPLKIAAHQEFNLTINYETFLIQIRGKVVKLLKHMPYCAVNETLIIYETMFTGPIQEYYIADIYDGAITLLNHIEKEYDDSSSQGNMQRIRRRKQNNRNKYKKMKQNLSQQYIAINRFINRQATDHLNAYSYWLLLQNQVGTYQNREKLNGQNMIYSNGTNIIIVELGSGAIQADICIQECMRPEHMSHDNCSDTEYKQYYRLRSTDGKASQYLVFNGEQIVYINYSVHQVSHKVKCIYKQTGYHVVEMAVADPASGPVVLLILNTTAQDSHGDHEYAINTILAYTGLGDGEVKMSSVTGIRFMATSQGILFYSKTVIAAPSHNNHDIEGQGIGSQIYICHLPVEQLLAGNYSIHQQCTVLKSIINPIYYTASVQTYYKLVPIHHVNILDQNSVKFLLLSRHSKAYHIQLLFTQSNQQGYEFEVHNCYVSLARFQAISFLGAYINQTSYDYFVMQYHELTTQPNAGPQYSDSGTIIVFYRYNDGFTQFCGHVSAWVNVNEFQVAHLLHVTDQLYYPMIQHQSLLLTLSEVFHLYKNLTFVLNYDSPSPVKYAVINARNPEFVNKFYSKLIYDPDPDDKYLWAYCWIGFAIVLFSLLILKVVSALIDRGIIRWTKSTSEDEDSAGSTGITVYFNSSSGGMLTQQTSYKSLSSP